MKIRSIKNQDILKSLIHVKLNEKRIILLGLFIGVLAQI